MGKLRKTNNFYVYGDVHNYVDDAQKFLDHEKPEKVIWLGDFFDSFDDGPEKAKKTALWVKKTMDERPQDVFIMSNHDVAYRFNVTDKYAICGWTPAKQNAIDSVFPHAYWDRFVMYHKEVWNGQDVYFSHAGIMPNFFPFERFDEKHLEMLAKMAVANGDKIGYNPLLDHQDGIIWVRWQRLKLFPGICQVVGHTTFSQPQIRATEKYPEWNICLDCAHTYYAIFKESHIVAVDRHRGSEHHLRLKP